MLRESSLFLPTGKDDGQGVVYATHDEVGKYKLFKQCAQTLSFLSPVKLASINSSGTDFHTFAEVIAATKKHHAYPLFLFKSTDWESLHGLQDAADRRWGRPLAQYPSPPPPPLPAVSARAVDTPSKRKK